MKYPFCFYCGKPTCVNPEYHLMNPYCSVACNIAFSEDGPLSSEEQEKNYEEALPAFKSKISEWRKKNHAITNKK